MPDRANLPRTPCRSTVDFSPTPSQTATSSLRWLILATLGCVATNGCGGQAAVIDGGGRPGPGGTTAGGAAGSGTAVSGGGAGGYRAEGGGSGGGGGTPGLRTLGVCLEGEAIGGGFERCRNGMIHRPAPLACTSSLPRPDGLTPEAIAASTIAYANQAGLSVDVDAGTDAGFQDAIECRTDSDCTAQPHGYCTIPSNAYGGLVGITRCAYGCQTDSECDDQYGDVCMCQGDLIGTCVPASCRSDDDCEGDLLCTDYVAQPGCGGRTFGCQTPQDECTANSQCSGGYCSPVSSAIRGCSGATCTIGRPFLVDARERLAGVLFRDDWTETALSADRMPAPDPELGQALGRAWARLGVMEHASVAAFARFSLQLLALGAPADLVEATTRAMQDETRHAKLCFSLAHRHSGEHIGPGELDVRGALDAWDLESVVLTTLEEGCIGETVAALEAAEALEHCVDAATREVLKGIVKDESAHAELAWRFVSWALERAPQLRATVGLRFEQLLNQTPPKAASGPMPTHERRMLQYGIVSNALRQQVRQRALTETVEPCARQLLALPEDKRAA